MARPRTLVFFVSVLALSTYAQPPICSAAGNVALYSNYDGGALNIVVDQNIPDLHIGVVSYEFSRITISGPFASNVVAVWYAGYNADNNHCNLIGSAFTTTISGVSAGTDSIMLYPPATWPNGNGYGSIICNYSCDITSNQGGCNTADQIAEFFLNAWGGILRYHFTQYGCWAPSYAISAGGNCCEDPLSTSVEGKKPMVDLVAYPNPANDHIMLADAGSVEVVDAMGRVLILDASAKGSGAAMLDVRSLPNGAYRFRALSSGSSGRFVVQH
ncbi:MAG: T9SS type A sorting domain-containing protein [Flavobacteriales bacterium]